MTVKIGDYYLFQKNTTSTTFTKLNPELTPETIPLVNQENTPKLTQRRLINPFKQLNSTQKNIQCPQENPQTLIQKNSHSLTSGVCRN